MLLGALKMNSLDRLVQVLNSKSVIFETSLILYGSLKVDYLGEKRTKEITEVL